MVKINGHPVTKAEFRAYICALIEAKKEEKKEE